MTANSRSLESGIAQDTIVPEVELSDLDADHRLLDLPGTSLVIFTSTGCASCRWAREHLPRAGLPVERLCWIDAGNNGGLVQRYEVFHLPALFVVRNGDFHGALHSSLRRDDLIQALDRALARPAEELP
ncbi:thioredoxin family protein [Pseudomonas sp. JM0905a]|uniref:thioredoxin family protein n=1 Tax=unclassified Pseudomonas TaxID=196821 RepID=UPI0016831C5B|nr:MULTISPECIES: thioredoxin family protein [unclassified Pseudomonas]MBD2836386.1 thioredoxin family protein [Pseudomonas sp. JM0905a]MDH4871908.1 thioredoxin family protein [Pseudomonas sp. BN515]